jgi:hypothetical protein
MADLLADLRAALAASAATPEFRADAEAYAEHRPAERVVVPGHAPRLKVARVLVQLAAAEPGLRVARVVVAGASGCADFRGTVVAEDAEGRAHRFAFVWDCRWRATSRAGSLRRARPTRGAPPRCSAGGASPSGGR